MTRLFFGGGPPVPKAVIKVQRAVPSASALPALANSPRAGRGARWSRRKMAAAVELDRLFRDAPW